jgi:hypothetical protein
MLGLQTTTKWQRFLLIMTIVLVACLLLALLAEAAVRVRHRIKYGTLWGIEDTYIVDPVYQLRILVPNSKIGPIHINSLGFRSPEIEIPKPSSTVRLAFLGASTTYGAEVSSNELTWPHLTMSMLPFQVIASAHPYETLNTE